MSFPVRNQSGPTTSSIVYEGPGQFSLLPAGPPPTRPGEILARVLAFGVCGTDKHIHDGRFMSVFPLVPGHEIVAEIEGAQGTEVVAIDNLTGCGACSFCTSGRRQFCPQLVARGVNAPGGAAPWVAVPIENCHPLGSTAALAGVLAEPLACVLHALEQAQLRQGQSVLIFGTGTGGQLLSQVARAQGARITVVVGRNERKLAVALRNGATAALNVNDALYQSRLDAAAPDGFDLVIDATGAAEVIENMPRYARIGGTILLYGMAPEATHVAIEPYDVFKRELHIVGSFAQGTTFARAVELLRNGAVVADGLITHRFELKDYAEALSAVGTGDCIKAVVDVAHPSATAIV